MRSTVRPGILGGPGPDMLQDRDQVIDDDGLRIRHPAVRELSPHVADQLIELLQFLRHRTLPVSRRTPDVQNGLRRSLRHDALAESPEML